MKAGQVNFLHLRSICRLRARRFANYGGRHSPRSQLRSKLGKVRAEAFLCKRAVALFARGGKFDVRKVDVKRLHPRFSENLLRPIQHRGKIPTGTDAPAARGVQMRKINAGHHPLAIGRAQSQHFLQRAVLVALAQRLRAEHDLRKFRKHFVRDAMHQRKSALVRRLAPDTVVLDPPRKGAEASALEAVARANPERIVYVSCNPATLARDAKLLAEKGYTLREAVPVDMFPWTAHVETVAWLSRENG